MIVLAHSDCGAIKLAIAGNRLHGAMTGVIDDIIPVVEKVRALKANWTEDEFEEAVTWENAKRVSEELLNKSQVIRDKVNSNELQVTFAVHDLESGKVTWGE